MQSSPREDDCGTVEMLDAPASTLNSSLVAVQGLVSGPRETPEMPPGPPPAKMANRPSCDWLFNATPHWLEPKPKPVASHLADALTC